jgi:ABC-type nitrate/sulfonate/bicarbonate transport system substrate-binding protein
VDRARLQVMYGHLEGTDGKFARDPSGYLSIQTGIYQKHGLDVSWRHVQGTEARYQQLEEGGAHLSMVVGRASLQHFLETKRTRILGCVMNSCSYYLVADAAVRKLADLRNRVVTCREGPARGVDFDRLFQQRAGLTLGRDVVLQLPNSDQEAFGLLLSGQAQAAWLPRPYAFLAEDKGFVRLEEGSDIVDDPLPITIETTTELLRQRADDFAIFLVAHREGIGYLRSHRADTIKLLETRFGHTPQLAAKTWADYLVCMDDGLRVDLPHLEKLICQIAPQSSADVRQVAAEWIAAGALRE